MAMLLAMFQKMRLIREKNQLSLEQMQYSSRLSRVEKNIKRTQEYYTSKEALLNSQAEKMKSQATTIFQTMFNLGVNSVNPYNYSGMNGYIANGIMALLGDNGSGVFIGNKDGDDPILEKLQDYTPEELIEYYSCNMGFQAYKHEDGTTRYGNPEGLSLTEHDYKVFMAAKNMATQKQQQDNFNCQQLSQQYTNNVSIWLEAQKAQLDAEQDAALEPLNYEQTMMEFNKEQADLRLKRIEQELQRYNELCSKEAENAAPSFGLG